MPSHSPARTAARVIRPLRHSALSLGLMMSLPALSASPTPVDDVDTSTTGAKTLDTVQVIGQSTGYVAARSSAGTKTDTPLSEVPQAISVITDEQVRDQNAQSLQETFRYTSGVRTDQYGLDNRGDWFSLRGGSSGTTLLDGMRLPLVGYYGVVREEPFAFERIEVLHGPASVMSGANAPGGVVNLVRKRPQETTQREVGVQLGSRDHRQVTLDATGPLNAGGTLRYRVSGLARDNDTQVEFADDHRRYVSPSLLWTPDDATSLLVFAEYQKDRNRNTNGFFPIVGTLVPSASGRILIDRFVGEPAWDRNGGERERIGYAFAHRLGDHWTLRHDLRHDDVEGQLRSTYARFFPDEDGNVYRDAAQRLLDRLAYATDDHARITNADLLLEGRFGGPRVSHTLLLGVDAMKLDAEQWASIDAYCPQPFDVYAPVYGTCAEPVIDRTDPTLFNASRVRQAGFLVQDQLKIDGRWVLVAGLRRDVAKTGDRIDRAWSRNLGAVRLLPGGWSPYLHYAESFQPVAGESRDGAPFSPSRGKQVEAGIKWMPEGGRFSATAAVYKLRETGRLTADPVDPNFSVQRGRVDAKGIELEAHADLARWDVVGSVTRAEAIDRSTGFRFESTPERAASLWIVRRFESVPGLRIGGGARYVGRTWDGADAIVTPSNTLYDAMASYDAGAWRFSLNAVNLTDKTYYATCLSRGDCWIGAKRRVVGEVAFRW